MKGLASAVCMLLNLKVKKYEYISVTKRTFQMTCGVYGVTRRVWVCLI